MGISTYYYTIIGISGDVEDHKEFFDYYEENSKILDQIPIMFDMDYKKFYLGDVMFDSGNLRYMDLEDTYVEFGHYEISIKEAKLKEKFKKIVEQRFHNVIDRPFNVITFMHCS